MNLSFRNFPFDFNPRDNFFRSLILEPRIQGIDLPDIDFYGCYPEKNLASKAFLYTKSRIYSSAMTDWLKFQNGTPVHLDKNKLNFWTTFENRRPPVDSSLYTFSFDIDSYKGRNFYLPLIYLYMDLELKTPYSPRHSVTQDFALNSRPIPKHLDFKNRKFACTFINNPHPTRIRAIREFSVNHEIDIFGRFSKNYVSQKIETGKNYWLNFCFENDLFPGYVTEKVLEAWLSYSIPVYWGDDAGRILNSDAIVNLKDFESMDQFLNYLDFLLNNQKIMKEMISQPILRKPLEIKELLEFIVNASNSE